MHRPTGNYLEPSLIGSRPIFPDGWIWKLLTSNGIASGQAGELRRGWPTPPFFYPPGHLERALGNSNGNGGQQTKTDPTGWAVISRGHVLDRAGRVSWGVDSLMLLLA